MALAAAGTASMSKALSVIGMVVSAILVILFVVNWMVEVPFGPGGTLSTIAFILAAAILGYLSWSTYREQV